MLRRIWALIKHWREVKSGFSTLSYLYSGKSDALDALGGLTDEEMSAVSSWVGEIPGSVVVEVGTLFGFTAREMARSNVGGRVIAVDNFSWNPFGLPPKIHEAFTRRILRGVALRLLIATARIGVRSSRARSIWCFLTRVIGMKMLRRNVSGLRRLG
jgi:hypothetical protein